MGLSHAVGASWAISSRGMETDPTVAATIRVFIDREYPRVVAAVGYATGRPDAAEDAVQEALIKVLADGHRPDRLAAWVTVVAINQVRGGQRRSRSEQRATERMSTPEAADPSSELADRIMVLTAVDALPDGQRTAVLLHYYLDASVADIAEALGVSEGTIKTQLHRGRSALAKALGEGR